MALYETLCRVLLVTSLATEQPSQLTVGLSTPQYVAPNGILFCLARQPPALLSNESLSVVSLSEGGSQFELSDTKLIDAEGDAFTSGRSWGLKRVEVTTLRTVLATDPFFAHSYDNRRYDDIVVDHNGASLSGLVVEEQPDGVGNCALITGAWKARTRYEVVLNMTNPASASSVPWPSVWMAPLTYTNVDAYHLGFKVRGPKYGQICDVRPGATGQPGIEPQLFNACRAARRDGLLSDPDTEDQQSCVVELRAALVRDPSLLQRSPYFFHPFNAPASLPTVEQGNLSCPDTDVPSLRNAGECISCETGTVSMNGTLCSCPPGSPTFLVGLQACGAEGSVLGDAPTMPALAEALCVKYSQKLTEMYQGFLSDRLVNSAFVSAFAEEAALLLDEAIIFEANKTVLEEYPMNERRPDSPSRADGIDPNCNLCDGEGKFEATVAWGQRLDMEADTAPRLTRHVQDERYDAVNKFRLIGAALNIAGRPCPALFDPAEPREGMYGPYVERICATNVDREL